MIMIMLLNTSTNLICSYAMTKQNLLTNYGRIPTHDRSIKRQIGRERDRSFGEERPPLRRDRAAQAEFCQYMWSITTSNSGDKSICEKNRFEIMATVGTCNCRFDSFALHLFHTNCCRNRTFTYTNGTLPSYKLQSSKPSISEFFLFFNFF